jgi:hypothetical protein
MERYMNLSGNSGVIAFEIAPGEITVQFERSGYYLYTDVSAGPSNILKMHSLARAGRGLGTFINQVVKHGYARKW